MREELGVAVPDERRLLAIIRAAFAQRRKTVENNLRAIGLAGLAVASGIDPTRRAETLTLEEFGALARRAADGIANGPCYS